MNLDESDLQFFVLGFPQIFSALLTKTGIDYPKCWIGVNILTKFLLDRDRDLKPGDIDYIVGRLRDDGTIDLSYLLAFQIKVCRVDLNDEPTIDSSGTTQATETARLGFDQTMLFHIVAQEEKSLPIGFAPSWSGMENVPHPRVFERLLGKIKARVGRDSRDWPFGYGVLGCGQIERSDPRLRGAFSPMLFVAAPQRPFLHNDLIRSNRALIEKALVRFFKGERYVATRQPVYLYSDPRGSIPRTFIDLPGG